MVVLPAALVGVTLTATAFAVARARRKDAANVWLAAFLALVAANYLLIAIADAITAPNAFGVRPALAHTLIAIAHAVQALDPAALWWFAGVYPVRNRLASTAARATVIAAAATMAFLLLTDAAAVSRLGSWQSLFAETYVTGSYVAVFIVWLRGHAAPDGVPRVPRLFLLGWAVVTFYRIGFAFQLGARFVEPDAFGPTLTPLMQFVMDGAASLTVFVVAMALARAVMADSASDLVRWVTRRGAAIMASLTIVLALPAVHIAVFYPLAAPAQGTVVMALSDLASHARFASRWLVFAVLAAPAFLANQVLDMDARLRRVTVAGTVAGVLIVAFVAAVAVFDAMVLTGRRSTVAAATVMIVLGFGATQAAHLGRRVAERLFPSQAEREEAYWQARRLELYRDALAAHDAGRLSSTDLEAVRTRIGIDDVTARAAAAITATPGRLVVTRGSRLAQRYVIERLIGRGGHGRAFLAQDERDNATVVVKEAAGASRAAVEREVTAARHVAHPRAVVPRDVFLEGDAAFVVYPFMPGGSLADRLSAGPVPRPAAKRMLLDVLDVLAAAHGAGIVHGDVTPGNVLLDADGRACLSDFGLARRLEDATATSLVDPRVAGTLGFVPPEALRGGRPTRAWDVYSVGVLGLRLLGLDEAPEDARDPFTATLAAATQPDAEARPADARAFAAALAAVEP